MALRTQTDRYEGSGRSVLDFQNRQRRSCHGGSDLAIGSARVRGRRRTFSVACAIKQNCPGCGGQNWYPPPQPRDTPHDGRGRTGLRRRLSQSATRSPGAPDGRSIAEIDSVVADMSASPMATSRFDITGEEAETEIGAMSRALAVFRAQCRPKAGSGKRPGDAGCPRTRRREQEERAEREARTEEEARLASGGRAQEHDRRNSPGRSGSGGRGGRRGGDFFPIASKTRFDDPELDGMARSIDRLVTVCRKRHRRNIAGSCAGWPRAHSTSGWMASSTVPSPTCSRASTGRSPRLSTLVADIAGASEIGRRAVRANE